MKRAKPLLFALTLAGVWLLTSSDRYIDYYGGYTPYFMERSELEKSVFYDAGTREIADPGKIWVRGDEIFVVERYKGVHIIDNSDPATPVQTGFIVAPGCMDVAVRDGVIYLDNAVDLVAFDLAGGMVTERLRDYFPEPASPSGQRYYGDYYNYYGYYYGDDDSYSHSGGMILVGWKRSDNK